MSRTADDIRVNYQSVAASATNTALAQSGGGKGSILRSLVLVVSTAATATVSIKDGSNTAIVVFPNSPGGGIGTYNVAFGEGIRSTSGAWQITTGAGVAVIAVGQF